MNVLYPTAILGRFFQDRLNYEYLFISELEFIIKMLLFSLVFVKKPLKVTFEPLNQGMSLLNKID